MLEVCNVWVGADSFRHQNVVGKQQQGDPLRKREMVQIIGVDQEQERAGPGQSPLALQM